MPVPGNPYGNPNPYAYNPSAWTGPGPQPANWGTRANWNTVPNFLESLMPNGHSNDQPLASDPTGMNIPYAVGGQWWLPSGTAPNAFGSSPDYAHSSDPAYTPTRLPWQGGGYAARWASDLMASPYPDLGPGGTPGEVNQGSPLPLTGLPPGGGGSSALDAAARRYGIDLRLYGPPSNDPGRYPDGTLTGTTPPTTIPTTTPGTTAPTTTPSPNANQINLGDLSSFFQNFLQQGQQQQPQSGLDLSGLGQYRSQLPYYSPG